MIKAIRRRYMAFVSYKKELKKTSKIKYYIIDGIETLVFALVFALIIRKYIIQTSLVPTGSMIPTLMVRDRLFVNKFVYQFKTPKRGDIVVFKSPHDDGKDYVKRCIGLSGETVEIRKGRVFINDKALIIPGVTLHRDVFNFPKVVVPTASYFMLGDNRGNSMDSRYWGYVPKEDLLGQAIFTFWPLDRMRILR
jgi:signal peptidase I